MNAIKGISGVLSGAILFSGCATVSNGPDGASGPELTHSYAVDSQTQYVQVGVEFTSFGDFVALVNPKRWKNPLAPGGSISWMNPGAWRHDWGRTGRILVGEAAILVVGVAATAGGGGGGDSGVGGPTAPTGGGGGTSPPAPPPPIGP